MRPLPKAFTLIELLIVVAIIAILAAIAVPNFLEAQTRSRVSRTKADMRSIATAIESYYVDHLRYPTIGIYPQPFSMPSGPNPTHGDVCIRTNAGLTSPIAYISSIPSDPFGPVQPDDLFTFGQTATIADGYYYSNKDWFNCRNFPWVMYQDMEESVPAEWVLMSKGPDKFFARPVELDGPGVAGVDRAHRFPYDPTNGTISVGNIIRTGPM